MYDVMFQLPNKLYLLEDDGTWTDADALGDWECLTPPRPEPGAPAEPDDDYGDE